MTYYIRPLVNTVAVNRTNDTVTIDGSVYYPIFHTPPSNSQSPQSSQNVNVNVNVTVGILWGTDTANLSVLSTLPYAGGNGAHRYESQTSDIQPGTLYYFAAYCDVAGGGRTIGEILALTTPPVVATPQPCPGNETVTDIDGNVYNTVQVGSQCWMKEDLRTTRFATGRAMNYAINNERFFNRSYNSLNGVMEGYYDAATSMADYGYPNASKSVPYYAYNSDQRILYNVWGALNGHNLSSTDDTKMQGACPDGWHVPSRNEWYELAEMMGGQPSSGYGVYLFDDLTRFTSASSGSGLALEESSIYWLNIQYARLAGMSDDVFYYTGVYLENYHDEFRLKIGNGGARHILNSVRCVKGDGETFAPVVRLGSEVTDLEAEAATLMPLVVVDGGKAVTSFRVLYGTSRTSLNRTLDVEEGMNEDENGNPVNYTRLTGLTPNTVYYAVAAATNANGTSYSDTIMFTTPVIMNRPCADAPTVTDIDGNVYNTVQVGNQCWMKEDLRTTHFATGKDINMDGRYDGYTYSYLYPYYGYDNSNRMLYNAAAVLNGYMDNADWATRKQGVCPEGWHVPSVNDWNELLETLGGVQVSDGQVLSNFKIDPSLLASSRTGSGLGLQINSLSINRYISSHQYRSPNVSTEAGICVPNVYYRHSDSLFIVQGGDFYMEYYRPSYSVRCVKGAGIVTTPAVVMHEVAVSGPEMATAVASVPFDGGSEVTSMVVRYGTQRDALTGTAEFDYSPNYGDLFHHTDITGLTPNTVYYAVAAATNANGTSYSDTIMFTTPVIMNRPCADAPTVTDIDGNVYNTVQVGNQCWMKEDLRTTKFATGRAMNYGQYSDLRYSFALGTLPFYAYNPDTQGERLGTVYNVFALANGRQLMYNRMNDPSSTLQIQGVCPDGWHLPSVNEWKDLAVSIGGEVERGTGYPWGNYIVDEAMLNSQTAGSGLGLLAYAAYASSNTSHYYNGNNVYGVGNYSHFESGQLYINIGGNLGFLMKVRCVKGEGETFAPVVRLGSEVTELTAESATLMPLIAVDGGKAVTSFRVLYGTSRTSLNRTLDVEEGMNEDENGNPVNYTRLTGLTPNTVYYAVAAATNANGTSYSDTIMFTTPRMTMNVACPGTPYVSDIEGNFYNTVQIGNQCWMKENLRTKRYADGTQIPFISDTTNGNRVAYYRYPTENNNYEVNIYGYFYSHAAVMRGAPVNYGAPIQGICPTGWHLPNKAEFDTLKANFTSTQVRDVAFWTNNPGTNESGLSLRAAGYYSNQSHSGFGTECLLWYSTTRDAMFNAYSNPTLWFWSLVASNNQYYLGSVRCIKGQGRTSFPPIVTTQSPYSYTQNTFSVKATVNKAGSTISRSGFVIGTSDNVTTATATSTQDVSIGTDGTMTKTSFSIPYNNQLNFTWYVRGYVTTSDGETVYGNAVKVEVQNVSCGTVSTTNPSVTYNTVQIGSQCWMKENLKTKGLLELGMYYDLNDRPTYKYSGNGYMLPYSSANGSLHSCNTWSGYYYTPNDVLSLSYSARASSWSYHNSIIPSNIKSICPDGWHLPNMAEYELMVTNVNGGYSPFTSSSSFSINQALSDKLRDNSSTYWSSYTTATNSSGFSARGAGYIPIYDFVTYVRASSHFITSSYASNYIIFALNPTSIGFEQQSSQLYRAISIRCVKDITDMTVSMNTDGIPISTQTLTVSARITNRYSYPIVERGFIFEGELKPQSTTSNSFQQTFTRTVGYGPTEIYAYVKLSDGSVHISKNYVSSSYGAVN